MQTEIIIMNQAKAAVIYSEECILKDVQSALDFMMSMKYETDCDRIALNKKAVAEEFFIVFFEFFHSISPYKKKREGEKAKWPANTHPLTIS